MNTRIYIDLFLFVMIVLLVLFLPVDAQNGYPGPATPTVTTVGYPAPATTMPTPTGTAVPASTPSDPTSIGMGGLRAESSHVNCNPLIAVLFAATVLVILIVAPYRRRSGRNPLPDHFKLPKTPPPAPPDDPGRRGS